jgi:zinc transport system permease protein
MFAYDFIQKALLALLFVSCSFPFIALNVSDRHSTMIGDVLSHVSLCGIAVGLASSLFPLGTAILISSLSGLLLEFIREKFPHNAEMALSILMALGLGITGFLTTYIPGNRLDSYLFGSLLTVSTLEVGILGGIALVTILSFLIFSRQLLYVSYCPEEAQASRIPVRLLRYGSALLVSLSVAVGSIILGSLLIVAVLSLPLATSLRLFHSRKALLLSSGVITAITGFFGVSFAYSFNFQTSSTIVILQAILLLLALLFSALRQHRKTTRIEDEKKLS